MNRLKQLREELGFNQSDIAEKIGITPQAYGLYENEKRDIGTQTLLKLSDIFNVDIEYILGKTNIRKKVDRNINLNIRDNIVFIPVYGSIKAGIPNFAEQEIIGTLPVDMSMLPTKEQEEIFFLKVDGESMNTIAPNGSFVLLKKQNNAENGDIVVALVNGYDATLKKYKKISDNIIMLQPLSNTDEFEDIIVDLEKTDFKILGVKIAIFKID